MEIKQSQLDYLKDRGGNYDRKYRMFDILIDKIPHKLNTVLELFGGVGIQSFYLQKAKDIKYHISLDIDDKCNRIARTLLPMVSRYEYDCFQFCYYQKIDLLVCDSVLNNKELNNVVGLVNKYDFEYLILTNTGVFNVRFNKQLNYEQYWDNLINKMRKCGLYVTNVVYSSDFGLMLVRKTETDKSEITKLEKGNISTEWRLKE